MWHTNLSQNIYTVYISFLSNSLACCWVMLFIDKAYLWNSRGHIKVNSSSGSRQKWRPCCLFVRLLLMMFSSSSKNDDGWMERKRKIHLLAPNPPECSSIRKAEKNQWRSLLFCIMLRTYCILDFGHFVNKQKGTPAKSLTQNAYCEAKGKRLTLIPTTFQYQETFTPGIHIEDLLGLVSRG